MFIWLIYAFIDFPLYIHILLEMGIVELTLNLAQS